MVQRTRRSYVHGLKFACGSSALALALGSGPAWAQDVSAEAQTAPVETAASASELADPASAAGPDEIVVTGIRQSLARAQDIKRDSDTVVDAITAEDIGALPDRSVNEALQRIPGVAITRFASAEDSQHFSVEGSGVVIRGLSYVRGEFNGRDTFAAGGGREIGFNDIAPELVGSVEVFKNLTADMIEGGISGVVNINTRRPFDSRNQLIYLAAEANYGDLAQRWAPNLTALYSNQWELSDGSRLGILVSGTYSRLYTQSHSAFVASPFERFNGTRTFNEGSPYESTVTDTFPVPEGFDSVFAPAGGGVRTQDFDRERYGISTALQYANPTNSVVATAMFLRTSGRNSWTEHTIEPNVYYPDVNASFPAPGTSYEFDENGVFLRGQIRRPSGPRMGNVPNGNGGSSWGALTNFQDDGIFTTFSNRGVVDESTTDDYSFNLLLNPSDRIRVNFDAQHVRSRVDAKDVIVDTGTWTDVFLDASGDIPQVEFQIGNVPAYGADQPTIDEYLANPNSIYFRDAFTNIQDNEGEEWAFRLDGEYDLSETGFFRRLRAGVRYADRDQVARSNNYNNWGAPSETWTGGGAQTFATIDASNYELYEFPSFFRGASTQPPSANFLRGNLAENYDQTQDLLRQITAAGQGNYVPIEDRACATVNTYFCPGEVNRNSETTLAGYVRLDFGTEFGDAVLDGNIGVRYVDTYGRAFGSLTAPQRNSILPTQYATIEEYCELPRDPGQELPPICQATPAEQERVLRFANGASYPLPAINQTGHWLPSLNIRFRPSEELQFRFAASRAISRPAFNQLRSFLTVNAGATASGDLVFTSGSGANPYLVPVESTNFDVTAEWYFSRVGSLTVAAFYKRLENIIDQNSQSVIDITNNGETYPVVLSGPANTLGHSDIKGFEIAYQQTFDFLPGPLAGFGVQATYTFVDAGNIPNTTAPNGPGDGARPPGDVNELYDNLPLTQLSRHNVNVAAFYERSGISARLAYSWRSGYLINVRDCCFPFLPVYNESTGQLDGSIFYNIGDRIRFGVQVSNILNEVTRTSFILAETDEGDLLRSRRAAFINDRRYSAAIRLSF